MDLDLAQTTAEIGGFATALWAWAIEFLPRLTGAAIVLAIGFFVAGWVSRGITAGARRTSHIDFTVVPILATVVRYAILLLVVLIALQQIGIQTTSLLAVLGAAGLAIGLALQGTLQNIAAGIMLLYLRPFRIGDTIETTVVTGKVEQIGLFASQLQTPDGLFYFVPNSALWNVPLKNHTRNPTRQINVQLRVAYDADIAEVRRILLEMAANDERIAREPKPQIFVDSYADTLVLVTFRAWAATRDFLDAQRTMAEDAKRRLQAAGIRISA